MWKISDARDSWATGTGQDLLASIVVSAQIRLTIGFGPKVPLYFRWHIRFRPDVIRHFRPTFGYGRKWNFHFRSTSTTYCVCGVNLLINWYTFCVSVCSELTYKVLFHAKICRMNIHWNVLNIRVCINFFDAHDKKNGANLSLFKAWVFLANNHLIYVMIEIGDLNEPDVNQPTLLSWCAKLIFG